MREDKDGTRYGLTKCLVQSNAQSWAVTQYDPARTFILSGEEWSKAHVRSASTTRPAEGQSSKPAIGVSWPDQQKRSVGPWNNLQRPALCGAGGHQPLSHPREQVQILEAACHRLLSNPQDDGSRAFLLEALAAYKAVPLACFPGAVHDLVATSRTQADALCVRILETDAGAGQSIDHEVEDVCHTLTALGEALKRGA